MGQPKERHHRRDPFWDRQTIWLTTLTVIAVISIAIVGWQAHQNNVQTRDRALCSENVKSVLIKRDDLLTKMNTVNAEESAAAAGLFVSIENWLERPEPQPKITAAFDEFTRGAIERGKTRSDLAEQLSKNPVPDLTCR